MTTEKPPRISANKLGEYMIASASRRKGIIRDQKRPSTMKQARYRLAAEPASDFLLHGDIGALHGAAGKLRSTLGGTDWAQGDRDATAEALEAIGRLNGKLFAVGITYAAPPHRPQKLQVGGIEISVQPDMLVFADIKGRPAVGALKLHYIKNEDSALTTKGAEFVATLLHQWVMAHGPSGRLATPALSRSVDVFRGAIVTAPVSQQRRMSDLEAACEEIAARWPTM